MENENYFREGDYVWLNVWDRSKPKHTIGQIIKVSSDNVFWGYYSIFVPVIKWVVDRPATAIRLATDSELAWFLVTHEEAQS